MDLEPKKNIEIRGKNIISLTENEVYFVFNNDGMKKDRYKRFLFDKIYYRELQELKKKENNNVLAYIYFEQNKILAIFIGQDSVPGYEDSSKITKKHYEDNKKYYDKYYDKYCYVIE